MMVACMFVGMLGVRRESGRRNRTGGNQFFAGGIDAYVKAFERAGAQERQVACLTEDYFINGDISLAAKDREADTSRNLLAISHDKGNVLFFVGDPELLQR